MEATKLLAVTFAVDVKLMPFGLIRKRIPFAVKSPAIVEADVPVTLIRTLEELDGSIIFTVSFWAMLNDDKLIIALLL